jgi:hypothetical protein
MDGLLNGTRVSGFTEFDQPREDVSHALADAASWLTAPPLFGDPSSRLSRSAWNRSASATACSSFWRVGSDQRFLPPP